MREQTKPSLNVQNELDAFCRQLLGPDAEESLRDELVDHLQTAFAEESAVVHGESAALQRVKDRFGDPQILSNLLLESQGSGHTRRGIEFFAAWMLVSGLNQVFVMAVWTVTGIATYHVSWRHILRMIPWPTLDTFMTLPTATLLTELCVAIFLTAVVLNRWQRRSPRPRRVIFNIAVGLLITLCFDSPLNVFFDSVATFAWHPKLSLSSLEYHLAVSGSFIAMVALGLIACRHVRALDSSKASLTCFGLAACVAMASTSRVLATILINAYAYHAYRYFLEGFASTLIFCIIAADVAWTLSWCFTFAAALPRRFQFAR